MSRVIDWNLKIQQIIANETNELWETQDGFQDICKNINMIIARLRISYSNTKPETQG
jgi:hypothetical protein